MAGEKEWLSLGNCCHSRVHIHDDPQKCEWEHDHACHEYSPLLTFRDYHGSRWVSITSNVALAPLKFLQFFSLKSVEKWPSYRPVTDCIRRKSCVYRSSHIQDGHEPSPATPSTSLREVVVTWQVATGTPNSEISQIGQLGLPKVPP